MAKRNPIQWELLNADWAAGIKDPRQMAREYFERTGQKVSHEGIRKHYEKVGLPRDLQGRIRQRAQEIVESKLTSQLTAEVVDEVHGQLTPAAQARVIEVAAKNQADIILRHRTDIQRYKNIASALIEELEATTQNKQLFDELGTLMRREDDKGVDRMNDAYQKVMSLPGRTGVMKQLAETLKILVGLERQAFGLSDNANGDADTPKDEPKAAPDNDTARRIAFILTNGTR